MVTCGSEMDGVDLDRELSLSTTSGKHMKFLGCQYVYLLVLRWRSCVDGISPLVFFDPLVRRRKLGSRFPLA